jgi:flagellar protein FlaC
LEEGSNSESNLKNSEKTNLDSKNRGDFFSDSKLEKNEAEIAAEKQNNNADNREKNGNRNIIRFDSEEGKDKESLSEPKKDVDETPESREESYDDEKNLSQIVRRNEILTKELEKKVASLSEDVDDLISLYEIVSIEMNPFVGLSKITRGRLDALDHIDKEFESLKARLEELEASIASGASVNQKNNYVAEDIDLKINVDDIIEEALDYIIEKNRIDEIIDEFIDDLKTENVAI